MTTTKNPNEIKIAFCCGLIGATASVTLNCLVADAKPSVMADNITPKEVQTAQQNWCDALIAISEAHAKSGLDVSKPLAAKVIDTAYAYQFGPVAFKPTWAKGKKNFSCNTRWCYFLFCWR